MEKQVKRRRLKSSSRQESKILLRKHKSKIVAGVDEAGRGPLAGPVVAAACILPILHAINGIMDSKKLTEPRREELFEEITSTQGVSWAVGIVEAKVIDQINILQATLLAMQKAVLSLPVKPDHILVDGNRLPNTPFSASTFIGGDDFSPSIGAASIIAKVTRDRLMRKLDKKYPQYLFAKNKGYGTSEHVDALEKYGPSPIHRKTFEPVALCLV